MNELMFLLLGIVTVNSSDHSLILPCVTFATTLIAYVPCSYQVFVAEPVDPEFTYDVQPLEVPLYSYN